MVEDVVDAVILRDAKERIRVCTIGRSSPVISELSRMEALHPLLCRLHDPSFAR